MGLPVPVQSDVLEKPADIMMGHWMERLLLTHWSFEDLISATKALERAWDLLEFDDPSGTRFKFEKRDCFWARRVLISFMMFGRERGDLNQFSEWVREQTTVNTDMFFEGIFEVNEEDIMDDGDSEPEFGDEIHSDEEMSDEETPTEEDVDFIDDEPQELMYGSRLIRAGPAFIRDADDGVVIYESSDDEEERPLKRSRPSWEDSDEELEKKRSCPPSSDFSSHEELDLYYSDSEDEELQLIEEITFDGYGATEEEADEQIRQQIQLLEPHQMDEVEEAEYVTVIEEDVEYIIIE